MSGAWLSVVGIGEDGAAGLGQAARALVAEATLVVGGARHLRLADSLIRGERMAWPSPMADGYPALLRREGEPVVVLASGDPFCFGVGPALAALVPPGALRCLPAPSCVALACARLGWAVQDTAVVSLCGRPLAGLIAHLRPRARLILLSADETTPEAVAALLQAQGWGGATLHVMEAVGGPRERVRRCRADALPDGIDRLNLLAAELGDGPARPPCGLADALFEHDGQLTKAEVRAVTLSALGGGDTLWDVGAGSGSVAIEWCGAGPHRRALAVERDAARAARAERNAAALGAPAVTVVAGEAPAALLGLPPPDAVFVGGGLQVPGVFDACWAALRPGGRLVANAVALDTQAMLFALQAAHGGTLTRIGIERLDRIGTMRAFRPAMPVVQWAVDKP